MGDESKKKAPKEAKARVSKRVASKNTHTYKKVTNTFLVGGFLITKKAK